MHSDEGTLIHFNPLVCLIKDGMKLGMNECHIGKVLE